MRHLLLLFIGFEITIDCHSARDDMNNPQIISLTSSASNEIIPTSEYDALNDLYVSTTGIYWRYPDGLVHWNFSDSNPNSPCVWAGLECIPDQYNASLSHISWMELSQYGLAGTIPESIGNLSELQWLDLSLNLLKGTIPQSITRLSKVYELSLNYNALTGPIPEDLSGFISLASLGLSNNNLRGGTVPESIGLLPRLHTLNLFNCVLSGPLPLSLGNLSALATLDFGMNRFNGTLPASLGLLQSIQQLKLSTNQLSGPIPPELGRLTTLTVLDLGDNRLTGTLPEALAGMTSLSSLLVPDNFLRGNLSVLTSVPTLRDVELGNNRITGSIPADIGALTQLSVLAVEWNDISGTLPDSLWTCTHLTTLFVYRTPLSGTISPAISNCQKLTYLSLYDNSLHGSLPSSLGSALNYIYLDHNQFTGELPASLAYLTSLREMTLADNKLSGSIPAQWSNMSSNLYSMQLQNNRLTGAIPGGLGGPHFTSLFRLDLSGNELSGTIPRSIWDSSIVGLLNLDANRLTGRVPDDLFENSPFSISVLALGDNLLSGTVPAALARLQNLVQLNVENNLLTGTLSPALSRFAQLETLFVNGNLLGGALDRVFNSSLEPKLVNVDVSNNQFTGLLPAEVFRIDTLQSFAAVSNCFSGSLPAAEMCAAQKLITLALDGLMSAESCRNPFFAHSTGIDSYWLTGSIRGGAPRCLFELPALKTLHLSGNGFAGAIPSGLNLTSSLTDLSLSNNNFRGEVPSTVQLHNWSNLDLSFNKLDGTLRSDYPAIGANATLSLQVNRLSGGVPAALQSAETIAILNGNLFTCDASRDSLPRHDVDVGDYECGSNAFDFALYAWLVATFCAAVVLFWLFLWHQRPVDSLKKAERARVRLQRRENSAVHSALQWMAVFAAEDRGSMFSHTAPLALDSANVTLLGEFMVQYRMGCLCVAAFALMLMLPMNAVLNGSFNTYTYEYAWAISSTYQSGVVAAVCLLVALLLLTLLCAAFFRKGSETAADAESAVIMTDGSSKRTAEYLTTGQYLTIALMVMLDVSLMVGVNVAYVYIHGNYSSAAVQATQIAVALFKIFWNNFAVRGLLKVNKQFIRANSGHSADKTIDRHTGMAVFVMLFNNLAAPFLATAFVSSNCFYDVVTTPASVSVSYLYASCDSYVYLSRHLQCTHYTYGADERVTSYIPPFTYSYQCSSAFVTTYASIYVFMFAFAAFGPPLAHGALLLVHNHTTPGSMLNRTVMRLLPSILKPPLQTAVTEAADADTWEDAALFSALDAAFSRRLFDCDLFVVQLVNLLAVLLTFGVVVPPLAAVGLLAIFSTTFVTQLCIGRFVTSVATSDSDLNSVVADNRPSVWSGALRSIDRDCAAAESMFAHSAWIAVPFVLVFYSFLLFDTLGDAVGWQRAVWMPVALCVVPLLLWLMYRLYACYTVALSDRQSRRSWARSGDIELDEEGGSLTGELLAERETFSNW